MSFLLPHRKLSWSEISLIPEALLNLFIFRIKVSLQPSRKWMPKVTSASTEKISAKKMRIAFLVAKVINGLAIRTPWKSTCLVKAMAAHHMLHKRQIVHKIHLGVAPLLNQGFEAHAWVSVENRVIIGGGNLENFKEIAQLG